MLALLIEACLWAVFLFFHLSVDKHFGRLDSAVSVDSADVDNMFGSLVENSTVVAGPTDPLSLENSPDSASGGCEDAHIRHGPFIDATRAARLVDAIVSVWVLARSVAIRQGIESEPMASSISDDSGAIAGHEFV